MTTPETIARACLEGAESDTMTFPEIVATLGEGGFESYLVDFRGAVTTYYRSTGEAIALGNQEGGGSIAGTLDKDALAAAIRDAQNLVPGYSYPGFCRKAKRAGCAGYLVSFPGRRALYFGRAGETHVEHFPPA